jgi:tetratricopeptide (TPR) repeat protein
MTSADPGTKIEKRLVDARLGRLLGTVFVLLALLVVNSVYLSAVTLLEQTGNEIYQDYFYLLMFLVHLVLGLLLTVPLIAVAFGHIRRAWSSPDRNATRAGIALFTGLILVLMSGLVLTRFGFLEINDPLVRHVSYWIHVIAPFAVVWLFVLHRLAGPPKRWRRAVRWSFVAAGFAAVMILAHIGTRMWARPERLTSFPPSLALIKGGETIPPAHLMTDEECRECHAGIAATHQHSMHRFSSFTNPPYRFSVKETREVVYRRDGSMQASRFCAACHDPVPLFSGRFDDPAYDVDNDPTSKAGITCATCHAITRVNSVRGNGAYTIVDPPSYPFAYSKSALLKAINHQLIRARPEFHKRNLLKPFHRSAEFCSLCHKVHLPRELNAYRWLRGQDHYDSFLFSGVSGHRIDSFNYPAHAVDRCSHCHMPLQASDDPAAKDFDNSGKRSIHLHQFPGADTGVAHLLKLPDQVMEAQRKQLHDVTRLDIFGIREGGTIGGHLYAPLRPALPALIPGRRYLVEIVLSATGVGHLLTQGTSDSNELWVEVTATANGRVIGRSGARNGAGDVDPRSYFVNAYLLDRHGARIDRRNAQDIFVALYNHQIPPGATSVVHYLLQVPEDIRGPVRIEASLNYRKFDTGYMRYVLGKGFRRNDLPITTMATDAVVLPVAGERKNIAAQRVTADAARRWNDYGIGLLLEGGGGTKAGLRQAEDAFDRVEALQDANGALNLARVYFNEGRLEAAARALRRASSGEPPAPPWTIAWYSALIDRENGHLDEAIESLRNIVDTRFRSARERGFDFSYDTRVLNMLARTLFERAGRERAQSQRAKRRDLLEQSRDWSLKTLAIDPEDLTAHYNLAQVYTDLGDTEKAERHRLLHEQYRPDDHAVEQAVTGHRTTNPAADHAAAAIAIYHLSRDRVDNVRVSKSPDRVRRPGSRYE